MPWCPNCKNEYRNGITTCADCNVALVDSLDDIEKVLDYTELAVVKHKDTAIRLIKYLSYSGIGTADIKADAEDKCYHILVDASEKKEAVKHYRAFRVVEMELSSQNQTSHDTQEEYAIDTEDEIDNDDDTEVVNLKDDDEADDAIDSEDEIDKRYADLVDFQEDVLEEAFEEEEKEPAPSHGSYVKKEDAYKDNHSTGTMFIGFSLVGLVFVGLNIAGVITFINGIFSYLVMSAMFIGFFLIGIYSLKHAKEVAAGIDAENEMTDKIHTYLESLGALTSIDEADWADLNDELLYFKRTNRLKEMVIEKFGEQNEDYLDCIIEEFYNDNVKA